MTVKELKDILDGCNEEAQVYLHGTDIGTVGVMPSDIYHEIVIPHEEDSSNMRVVIYLPGESPEIDY